MHDRAVVSLRHDDRVTSARVRGSSARLRDGSEFVLLVVVLSVRNLKKIIIIFNDFDLIDL